MRTSSFAINTNSRMPDAAIGFVKAEIVTKALALNGHVEVNLYPLPGNDEWTGDETELVQTMSPCAFEASGTHWQWVLLTVGLASGDQTRRAVRRCRFWSTSGRQPSAASEDVPQHPKSPRLNMRNDEVGTQ
jgi:hypothetical protein